MTTDAAPRVRDEVGSYDDIAAAAVRTTGLDDFGGTEHEEGLRILVDDLNSPAAGLTGEGNYLQRGQVKSCLVGRLLTQFGMKENPAYATSGWSGRCSWWGSPAPAPRRCTAC